MSIRIDQKKCVGCRKCSEVCPGTLIVMEDKKAVMKKCNIKNLIY